MKHGWLSDDLLTRGLSYVNVGFPFKITTLDNGWEYGLVGRSMDDVVVYEYFSSLNTRGDLKKFDLELHKQTEVLGRHVSGKRVLMYSRSVEIIPEIGFCIGFASNLINYLSEKTDTLEELMSAIIEVLDRCNYHPTRIYFSEFLPKYGYRLLQTYRANSIRSKFLVDGTENYFVMTKNKNRPRDEYTLLLDEQYNREFRQPCEGFPYGRAV
jgi:hypothetical protein